VQLALVGLDGVEQVRVLVPSHELQVTYDPTRISAEDITRAVRAAPASGESGNYDAAPLPASTPEVKAAATP
jgi:copper chaperone CopZ